MIDAELLAEASKPLDAAPRLERLRAAMTERGCRAAYVRNLSDVKWLTALDGVFDTEPAHALLVTPERAVLHTDGRYARACRRAVQVQGSPVEVNDSACSHDAFAARLVAEAFRDGDALMVEDSLSVFAHDRLVAALRADAPQAGSLATHDVVLGLREVKDEGECLRMRAAQSFTDDGWDHVVRTARAGMTERECALELEFHMLRQGAQGLAFGTIFASGPNGADPHAIPGGRRLAPGDVVVCDFGAAFMGYMSDMTRCLSVGEPSEETARAWAALRETNESCEAMVREGAVGADVHLHAELTLARLGYPGQPGHGLGHGVGVDIHEEPVLAPRNGLPLACGNVVTVEPGIYLEGSFGMRLEDFGVVTREGYDVFTRSSHELAVV